MCHVTVFVKICGMREQRHVAAAINAGADALGFVFADSPRRISPDDAAAISCDVPDNIRRVAVMLHPSKDAWQEVLEKFAPDVLQTDADDMATLDVPDSIELWPVFRAGRTAPNTNSTYVYEGPKSGVGETVDWSQAAALAEQGQMILAGGLSAQNVAAAITTVRPFGVDVSSAVESAAGQKDARMIAEFVNAVRAAEKNV